ncbi:MAG: hypothetical protein ISN29_08340, partial [Gammaproteobacteria bacterium AqS3]|nr:hypothetical protein [Gammaproteobacteria bacterium AqS3]
MDSPIIPPLSFCCADPVARLRHRLSRLAGALLLGAALAAPGAWAEDIELERSYEGTVNVQEGFSSGFFLTLKSQPDSNIELTLTLTGSKDVSVSPTSLTFTTSNWDISQEVQVRAAGDNDNTDDETATLTISGTGVVTKVVPIAVEDDDTALVVSESSLTMTESGSQTFTVRLAEQLDLGYRDRVVRLTVTGQDSGDIKVSPTSLTFTRENSLNNRTVTVRAEQDDDPIDDTATITLSGSSIVSSSVSVTVDDDDDTHVGVTTSDLEQLTEGASKTFTVALASQPGNARKVELAVAGNPDVTVSPTELNFTRSDWNTAQTVTVRAAQDVDQTDDTATINLTGNGITAGAVSVSVHDDDDNDVGLTLTHLDELIEGGSKTFTVRLSNQPRNARKVLLAVSGDDDVTVSPDELEFTTSNWGDAQTVTVSAEEDADQADDTATVRLSGRRITSASVNVKVDDDDDDHVGLVLSDLSDLDDLVEGGSKTFTVRLTSLPGNARRVALTVTDNGDVTVSPTSLNFTTSNWGTAQTVTVNAGHDDDQIDDTATISLTGDGITTDSVSASVEDDDDADVALALSDLEELTEGGSETFTVKLASQPANARRVALAVIGNDEVTVEPRALNFTTSNWGMAQTVTVHAADDIDQSDDTATISLTGRRITSGSVSVTVNDISVGLALSALEELTEGGSQTFTVKLEAQPDNAREVTLAVRGDADVTVAPTSLDFSTTDWNTAQILTVSAGEDADKTDDTATIILAVDGIESGSVDVTVDDNDDADVGLTLSDLENLPEGGSRSFTVQLTAQPGNARRVALAISGDADVTFGPASLDFTPAGWDTAQTVTVRAGYDADQVDDTATISLTGDGITAGSVSVKVDDDDDAVVGLALSALDDLTEGGSKTFTVELTAQPGNARRIALAVTGDSDVRVSPASLDFTPADWGVAQTVTVSAAQDLDQVDDTATISLTGQRITSGSVSVTVDDTSVGLTLSALDGLTEGGSESFTVQLAALPDSARKVALTVIGDADVTVAPNTLDFNAGNWNTARTVTVSAGQDSDKTDDTATVRLAVDGTLSGSVDVTVEDDDDVAVGLTLSDLDDLTEGGSKTFTVELATQPGNARKVMLAVTGDASVTVSPASLDFTPANWSAAQTVTVSAGQDADKADGSTTINLTGDGITAAAVSASVEDDDDVDVGLTLSDLDELTEGGSKTFTVKLAVQPGNARKVTLLVNGDTDVTLDPGFLDFTTSNWNTARTVTVSAADDADKVDDTATINLIGDGITSDSVSVKVDDDDDADVGLVLSDFDGLVEGSSGTFTVALAALPGNARKVALTVTDNADVTVTPNELNFSTTDWNTAQTVSVRAAEDADYVDDTATISLSGDGITFSSVDVKVDDDDDVNVALALSALAGLTEGGSETFTVKLAEQPVNARKIALTVSGDDDVTVSPTSLNFTTSNWNTAQTVTVSAAQDPDQRDDTATVNLTGGGIFPNSVSVSVDDISVGLVLSSRLLRPTEGGSANFTVKLEERPDSDSKVTLTVDGDDDVTITQNELDFTADNWNSTQTVTVRAAQDADQTDDTATITLAVDGIISGAVSVTVADDDDSDVSLTLSDLDNLDDLDEGGSQTFKVQLGAQPSNGRVILLNATGDSDVGVTPRLLAFSTSNWNTAQTVTVSAQHDTDRADDTATINLSGAGITGGSVSVTVTADDDEDTDVGLTLSALDELTEGGSKTLTVTLAGQPGNARKVALAVTGDADVTVTPDELSFPPSGWNSVRIVTVSAAQDTDKADDAATISLTGDGITTGSVAVTVDDDDDADVGLVLSDLETLAEGGSKTFTVTLAALPGNARKVALAVTGDNDVTVSPIALDFTTSNWDTAQTVTVRAAQDTDLVDDSASVSLTGDGITAGSVSVAVDDDDDDDIGLTLSDLDNLDDLVEGGSQTFTVQLAAQPGNARSVALTVTGSNDVTVSPTSLSFDATNWNMAQTVTVSAAQDVDDNDDTATISLTGDGITSGSVSVTVDDESVFLVLSSVLSVNEGSSATFTVKPHEAPDDDLKVTLTLADNGDVTVTPNELNFTTSDWNNNKTVTVRAGQDDDRVNDTATIRLAVGGALSGLVLVTVFDDDDTDVALTLSDLDELVEGGSQTFTVQLAAQPANARIITLGVAGDDDVTVAPKSLVFSTSNWNTAQTVTVSAVEDTDQADDTATVSLVGSGITHQSVSVTVDDNDDVAVGLTLSALAKLAEGGSQTFTVKLATQPGNARKVALAVTGDDDVTVASVELDFTTADWNTAQTVTVSAKQDADQADDTATINLTGDGITAGSVAVTVDDDDDTDVGLTLSDLDELAEGGSETFTVKLAMQPGNARKVMLAASGDGDVTVSPASLDFTTANWSSAQTVTVRSVQDADQADDAATISLTGDGITADSVSVTVIDDEDDDVGLTLSTLAKVTEGGSQTF